MKIAAIEGMWETEPAPASFNLFGIPIQSEHITRYRIQIPYILGLMATRSFHQVLPGINELVQQNKGRIQNGIKAYSALTTLEKNPNNIVEQRLFKKYENELGYGLLLKRFIDDPTKATPAEIDKAAWLTVPANVAILFWAFRIMVGVGFFFIYFICYRILFLHRSAIRQKMVPLPFVTQLTVTLDRRGARLVCR